MRELDGLGEAELVGRPRTIAPAQYQYATFAVLNYGLGKRGSAATTFNV